MRTLIILTLIISLSVVTGCSVPKKRSWAKREGRSGFSVQETGSKRTWGKKRSFPQGSVRLAANRRSIWIKTNRTLEDMARVEGRTRASELEPVETETEISIDEELEALKLTENWDDPQIAEIPKTVIAEVPESAVISDFPIIINHQVEVYLELFQGTLRATFSQWLARSGRYLEVMEAAFDAAGLPRDLTYLSMIESGFSQRAYSKAQAVGLWQFMSATGREYGLEVNEFVDERRGIEQPTEAAVAYLSDLYKEFGDWHLAVAAYNGGPGTLRNAIRKSGTNDFWEIVQMGYLPQETRRYVPKLIAAIMIAKEPEKYRFTDITYDEPLSYDTIDVGPGLSFDAIAMLTNSKSTLIKSLNQELLTGKTPIDLETYTLKVPSGTGELAAGNLSLLHNRFSTDIRNQLFTNEAGLMQVLRKYSLSVSALPKPDDLTNNRLFAWYRPRIPFNTLQYLIIPEG